MRVFWLRRNVDPSGISGTGRVLEGVLLPSGRVLVEWRPPMCSLSLYDDMEQFKRIFLEGHPGCSEIIWLPVWLPRPE